MPSKKPPTVGHIRIIAGFWRRHQLPVLVHEGLRPSGDRVRETVFNWLHHLCGGQFSELSVLDVFAGTGAFGLECVSRGARDVSLIDAHAPAMTAIRNTLNHWRTQDASVAQVQTFSVDALRALREFASASETYDLIFLDPPFAQGWLSKILPLIAPICHEDSVLYIELEKGANVDELSTAGWQCVREGHTQQVHYSVWLRA